MKRVEYSKLEASFFQYARLDEMPSVRAMLEDVRKNGDKAVRKYAIQFDGLEENEPFELTREQIRSAYAQVEPATLEALKTAARRIRSFAQKQMDSMKEFESEEEGLMLGQKIVPLGRVGCYVPGGRYPLPSTALMTAIPAKVAGVKEVIVCSPKIKAATIVAADLAGADRIFNLGGVQAVGAMAYGTASVPRVDKIVGPGNQYVTAAKKNVYGEVGIDFIAGPSEVMVVADETADAAFVAADMLAQAEHDTAARADLITDSKALAEKVAAELQRQLSVLPTREVAEKALQNGCIVLVDSMEQAVEIADRRAPEHLELQGKKAEKLALQFSNYGSLFIGPWCAEVFGDYCSGTNHTLPTNGAARYTGGLSVKDYVKVLTYQKAGEKGAKKLAPVASELARVEGLFGHKNAADVRARK
ncbi:Histidinol dehydrogenase [uncultured archaeon]|nr:Histidinol dehydrogenase [uncultured archaeon]